MSHLRHLFAQISIFTAVALSTAGCIMEDYPDTPGGDATAYLRIRVGTPDPLQRSRAIDIDPAATSAELMHTLRIIIVGEDGVVEHNRHINFDKPNGTNISGYETFIVQGNEKKTIYTFANEESLPDELEEKIRAIPLGQSLSKYWSDLETTEVSWGQQIPVVEKSDDSKVFDGTAVFMSRKTIIPAEDLAVDVDNADHAMITVSRDIVIIRAAVKLTYKIFNFSSAPVTLNQIMFNGLTDIEYILPTKITLSSELAPAAGAADNRYIIEYSTPAGLEKGNVTLFGLNEKSVEIPVTTPAAQGEQQKPSQTFDFYVNEAPIWNADGGYSVNEAFKVPDDQTGSSPYSTSLVFNELTFDGAFDNLPALPRNTHVIANIIINDPQSITCYVQVVPYISVVLNPWFGFEEPYPPFTPPTQD